MNQRPFASRTPSTIALVATLVALAIALTAVRDAHAAAPARSLLPVRVLLAGGARPVPLAGASVALRAARAPSPSGAPTAGAWR